MEKTWVKKKLSNLTIQVFCDLGLLFHGIFSCPRIVIGDALLNILFFSLKGENKL